MNIQIRNLKSLGLVLLTIFALSFTSCNKEPELVDIESFTDSSIERIQNGVVGKTACLEFVFPISIQFVDETTAEISDYDNLYETILAWFEANDSELSKENKPELIFPIQVLNEAGEIVEVTDLETLKELKKECPNTGKCKGKNGKGFKCFSLGYPLTITIDGTDTTFEDRATLKTAIKTYKEEVGDEAVKPTLVFPITIVYDDESEVDVASQEELLALKEACRAE